MNRVSFALSAVILLASAASAQLDNFPPGARIISWTVNGQIVYTAPATPTSFEDFVRSDTIRAFQHKEFDRIAVELELTDPDWTRALAEINAQVVAPGEDPPEPPDYEDVFVQLRVFASQDSPLAPRIVFIQKSFTRIDLDGDGIPDPQSSAVELDKFEGPSQGSGFVPIQDFEFGDTGPPKSFVEYVFDLPKFLGKNQARLDPTDPTNFDIFYFFDFGVANEETPQDEAGEFSIDPFTNVPFFPGCSGCRFVAPVQLVAVIQNPALEPPNPPAFADAAASSVLVVSGSPVILDARRSFDSFNVGFNDDTPRVFDKDVLQYTWEWISGPARVDPVQAGVTDPTATVTMTVAGDYVFRVLVSDSSGNLPTTASVTITVLERQPTNNPPNAAIVGPRNAVPVGSLITLDGSFSTDPDGDPLTFRWRQVNALGDDLMSDELVSSFQPMSGIDTPTSTWQAVAPGQYFFRLLVRDAEFVSANTFTVNVVGTETAGITETPPQPASDSDVIGAPSTPASDTSGPAQPLFPLCAAGGLFPLALAPLALLALRRRQPRM